MRFPASFQRLAAANLAAQSAEQLSLAAVPLVAVLVLGSGAGEIGLLAAIQTLPFPLLSIPLGLLADRLPRGTLMVAAESLRALPGRSAPPWAVRQARRGARRPASGSPLPVSCCRPA